MKVNKTTLRIKNPKYARNQKKVTRYVPVPRKMPLDVEQKSLDVISTIALSPNNGTSGSWSTPVLLNGAAQGVNSGQRVGRKVHCTSFLLRVTPFSAVAPTTTPRVRVLVVWDNAPNQLLATPADILLVSTSSESPMNLANSDRFRIIADFYTNKSGYQALGTSGVPEEPEFRRISIPSTYAPSAGGTIADMTKGALLMLVTSNMVNANLPSVSYVSRVRYTDV